MAQHLQPGIDEIRGFDGELFVERRVDTTQWVGLGPDGKRQGGTLDAGVAGKKLIVLSDLKFGMGRPVQAVDNDQQQLYALSFWEQIARHLTSATDFLIIIDQPRNSAGGGSWHVTLKQLQEYGEFLRERARATNVENAPLVPGHKQCEWCPAANVPGRAGGCPAHHEWIADIIHLKFEALDEMDELGADWTPPSYHRLTPERRSHIVRQKSAIERWLSRLHADELAARITGGPSCGLKAVYGRRPPQKWRDPVTAEAFLEQKINDRDKLFIRKLISPTQGEKLAGYKKGQHFPAALVDRGEPKPVLAPEADSRPAIRTVDEMFDDEDDADPTTVTN